LEARPASAAQPPVTGARGESHQVEGVGDGVLDPPQPAPAHGAGDADQAQHRARSRRGSGAKRTRETPLTKRCTLLCAIREFTGVTRQTALQRASAIKTRRTQGMRPKLSRRAVEMLW
jgi:hypothetical protein